MKRLSLILLIIAIALSGCNYRLKYPEYPVITNVDQVEMLSPSSAMLVTYLESDGGTKIQTYGICWDTSINPTIISSLKMKELSGNIKFNAVMEGLLINKTYYVRPYAVNEVGVAYGKQIIFETKGNIPTIQTQDITNITGLTFNAGGTIIDNGNWPITSQGICWAYGSSPTLENANGIVLVDSTLNAFNKVVEITNDKRINIHVRAFASNKVGTSYGDTKIIFLNSPYHIGQNAFGGYIFFIDATGSHGLVASTYQHSTFKWGCTGTYLSSTNGVDIGTGSQNTNSIVSSCSDPQTAAKECNNLLFGGYDDWCLPSQMELNSFYYSLKLNNSDIAGVLLDNMLYWSSTQADSNNAYALNLSNGKFIKTSKETSLFVRAIRSF
jgi:hypothetical protein